MNNTARGVSQDEIGVVVAWIRLASTPSYQSFRVILGSPTLKDQEPYKSIRIAHEQLEYEVMKIKQAIQENK